MTTLTLDEQWLRIDNEMDTNGNRTTPVYARNARSRGGMIVGRLVCHMDGSRSFDAQSWRGGKFDSVGKFETREEACKALENVSV